MVRVYECVGRYAAEPLTIRNTYIRVWCLEELCYYICENADLLEDGFASNELIDWIADECGLKELSSRLKTVRRQSVKLESFIAEILNAAGYVDEDEIKRIGRVIRANRNMSETGRMMVLADYFLRGGHFVPALHTYERLLGMKEGLDVRQLVRVYQNLAVIYAGLFCYREAAEHYMKAFELEPSEEMMFGYLAARRMELGDMEYLKLLSTLDPDYSSVSAAVEEAMESARKEYAVSARGGITDGLRKLRMGSDRSEYAADATAFLQEEKDNYRKYMAE